MVVGDISTGTDVLVIGGGPGGYTAAIRAGQLDLDVTLVERDALGGVCLNRGCIPSKALVSATGLAEEARHAGDRGIHATVDVDLPGMAAWKDDVVDQLTDGVGKLCKANGVTVVDGRAEFSGPTTARVVHEGEGEGAETLEFEHAVIATGSRPIELPGFAFDGERILDSADALALDTVPDRLLVVGGGYIGMELSTVFARLGADVTVIEMLDDVLPGFEADLARVVKRRAEALGVDFRFRTAADEWRPDGDGVVVTAEEEDGGTEEFPADRVLVAVGRDPVTDTLGLDALGLEPDDDGFIATDDQARTGIDTVYAVGDVAGDPMLAHAAMMEGEVAAEVIAGRAVGLDYQAVPAAVFTDPEIGTVGMTADEADEAGFEVAVGEFPFRASGRALTTADTEGFVRVVADADSGFVLGGQVVGREASELIAEIGLAVELGARLEDVTATVHTHPTRSEAVREAAANALGHAIHTLNR